MKKHLSSKREFTNWLSTMYLFYLINRLVDFDEGIKLLPEIHYRLGNGGFRKSVRKEEQKHPVMIAQGV